MEEVIGDFDSSVLEVAASYALDGVRDLVTRVSPREQLVGVVAVSIPGERGSEAMRLVRQVIGARDSRINLLKEKGMWGR